MDQTRSLGGMLTVVKQGQQYMSMQTLLAKRGKRAFDGLACKLVLEQ